MTLFQLLFWSLIFPQDADIQLNAPNRAPAGSAIEISWSQNGAERDFITIVPKGAAEGVYKQYAYARSKVWQTTAPDEPGEYEIRYLGADAPYPTLASQPLVAEPVTAAISVPATADAGSEITIEWDGPGNPRDFITIVKKGTPERTYGKYVYTKRGNPAKLIAPDESGDYEIRYCSGVMYLTLASAPVKVGAVSATVTAPAQANAGSVIEVHWTGPDNPRDFITIVKKDTPERQYGKYVYTTKGSPVTLPVPDEPGAYEVRYCTGGKYLTLASAAVNVGSVNASLSVDKTVPAGTPLKITWTGPDNPRDFITIVPAGSPEKIYKKYAYTDKGNPATIPVPDEPGRYEVRYCTGQTYATLASATIEVVPAKATVQAPAEVKAGTTFEVAWTGPGNPQDFIATAKKGAGPNGWETYQYTRAGQPSKLRAPLEPGDYVVRYQTGQKYFILAEQAIKITPPDVKPGRIRVVFEKPQAAIADEAGLELILDASGSMLQRLDGKRRIEIAKEVLIDLVENQLPPGTPVAMRVFGHREADSCRTDLEMPLAPLAVGATVAQIKKIQAMNLAKTPIAASLAQVANDLAGVEGQRLVVLITDGEETCGGDPAEAITKLKEAGIDIRVNIVGFAIDNDDLKKSFALWSDLGGGNYFDARNASQLSDSISGALQIPYDLINEAGEVVAEGLVGGYPVEVPAGTYSLKTRETPAREVKGVEIPPGEQATVNLK